MHGRLRTYSQRLQKTVSFETSIARNSRPLKRSKKAPLFLLFYHISLFVPTGIQTREKDTGELQRKYTEADESSAAVMLVFPCFPVVQRGGRIRYLPEVADFAAPADLCLLRASFSRENVRRNDHSVGAQRLLARGKCSL